MSFAPEVCTDNSGKYIGNGLRFATYQEALENASDLMMRWMMVRNFRVVESTDPVNYRYVNGELQAIE